MSSFLSSLVSSSSTLMQTVIQKSGLNNPFTVQEKIEMDFATEQQTIFSVHRGVRRDDSSQITVFVFDCVRQRHYLPLAKNTLKRFKTIRHPDILKYIDSFETEEKILIATEPALPLSNFLKTNNDANLNSWGLYKIANAVKFLNTDCNVIHGNLRASSIYVTKAGEFKLAGLEVLCSLNEPSPALIEFGNQLPDASKYQPLEVQRGGWSVIRNSPVTATDSWGYACLVYEVFNGPFSRSDQLHTRGAIPDQLHQFMRPLLNPQPASRGTMAQLVDYGTRPGNYFDNDFIQMILFLEGMAVKEKADKELFVKKLMESLDRKDFPMEFLKYKVLPELANSLEFGGGPPKLLNPILKIGEALSPEEYETVVNILVRLFTSNDRGIRVALCDNVPSFMDKLKEKVVSEKIWPQISQGFADTSAFLRECTLKTVTYMTPKLTERIVNNDLLRFLAKLQADEEPGIRTNTTICLGKISKYLSESTRRKVMAAAFVRSLSDPFPPARNAGLLALSATSEYYEPLEIAQRIIPGLVPLCLDPEKLNRTQAFKTLEVFIKRLEQHANTMPETALPPSTSTSNPAASQNGSMPQQQQQQQQGDGWTGWAGSAVSSLAGSAVKRLVGDDVAPSSSQTRGNTSSGNNFSNTSSATGNKNAAPSYNGGMLQPSKTAPSPALSSKSTNSADSLAAQFQSTGFGNTPTSGFSNPPSTSTSGGGMKLPKHNANAWNDNLLGFDEPVATKPNPASFFSTSSTNNGWDSSGWGTTTTSAGTSKPAAAPTNSAFSPKPASTTLFTTTAAPKPSTPAAASSTADGWGSWDNNPWETTASQQSGNSGTFKVEVKPYFGNKKSASGRH